MNVISDHHNLYLNYIKNYKIEIVSTIWEFAITMWRPGKNYMCLKLNSKVKIRYKKIHLIHNNPHDDNSLPLV